MDTILNKINNFSKNKIFLTTISAYLICAYFSSGFAHPDEHFQIFPPLMVKMGIFDFAHLSWEFQEKMRSYLLPSIFWNSSFLPLRLGWIDPFQTAFLSRALLGLLSLWSTHFFCKNYYQNKQEMILPSFVFTSLFWFVPFLHVRTSSENFSFFLILLGLACFLSKLKWSIRLVLTFFFFYLAVHSRLQVSLMVLGFLFFNLKQFRLQEYFYAFCGTVLALAFSFIIDFWGYGEFVYTPWHYFYQNIILKKSTSFGTSPPWHYFTLTFLKSYGVWWPCLFSFVCLYFYNFRKNLITFILLPFILAHFLIAHKELRFLNAFYFFIPFMIFELWTSEKIKLPKILKPHRIYFSANLIFLFAILIIPASKDEVFYRALDGLLGNRDSIFVEDQKFSLEMEFFNSKKLKIENVALNNSEKFFFLTTDYKQFEASLANKNCEVRYSSYPLWQLSLLPEKIKNRSSVLALFNCLRAR